jgi:hypothetical protein
MPVFKSQYAGSLHQISPVDAAGIKPTRRASKIQINESVIIGMTIALRFFANFNECAKRVDILLDSD